MNIISNSCVGSQVRYLRDTKPRNHYPAVQMCDGHNFIKNKRHMPGVSS